MLTKDDLLACADQFRVLTGVEEVTLSYRMFGDTKKLRVLRGDAGITLDRFNAGMTWFATNWPEGADLPEKLQAFLPPTDTKDAA
jgi:hypothetical protein